MKVNHYTQRKGGFAPELERQIEIFLNNTKLKSKYDNKNIGYIDWWWCSYEEKQIENLEQFVKSQDLCFFISEEIIKYGLEFTNSDCEKMFTMLNNYNVYFLMFSEEDFNTKTDPNKTYNVPWFFKRSLYMPSNLSIDFDYKHKEYAFNLLLGSNKHYRTIMYHIFKNNPNIYTTYLGHPKYKYSQKNNLDSEDIKLALLSQDVSNEKLNTMLEVDDYKAEISHIIPTEIYAQTHFDIVSESQADNNINFTTEKTAKPLATGRFFIYVGKGNVFKYLKSYGFSFENYLTDYNLDQDLISRINRTTELITEITENPNMIKDIYVKTRSERLHNMHNYKKHTKQFFDNIKMWFSDCLFKL